MLAEIDCIVGVLDALEPGELGHVGCDASLFFLFALRELGS